MIALHQGRNHVRGQVVRANAGQRAAQVPYRGAQRIHNHDISHGKPPGKGHEGMELLYHRAREGSRASQS